MKKKSQEKKRKSGISHLKTLKATSLSGSVSNCKYNSAEVRQKTMEDSISQVSNASLSLQLNKSRKENVELESFIKKLEETIKQQNLDMETLSNLTAHMESPWLNDEANVIYMERIISKYKTNGQMFADVIYMKEKLEIIENSQHWQKISNIIQIYEKKFDDQEKEISSLKAQFGSVRKTCNAEAAIEDDSKKFPKESNASLSLQLKKSRKEKVRLNSIIQNLKDTIVEQEVNMLKPEARSLWLIKQEREMYLRCIDLLSNRGDNLFAEIEKLKKKVCEIEDTEDAENLEKKISDIKMDYEKKYRAQEEELLRLKAKLPNVTC